MSAADGLPKPRNLLIFRNGNLGNTLVSEPLIRNLKKQLACRITVIVDRIGHETLSGSPHIDRLIEYNKRTTHKGFFAYWRFVRQLRQEKFDTVILLKRFFRNEMLAWLAGIPVRIGFATPGVRNFRLTATLPYSEEENIISQNLRFLQFWQLKTVDPVPRIALAKEDLQSAEDFLTAHGFSNKPFLTCHFGGETVQNRRWPAENYAELLRDLIDTTDINIVLLSSGREQEFNSRITAESGKTNNRLINAHNLPLKVSAALIRKSGFFIGNDSGPSHLAEAVNCPGAIFYTHQDDVKRQIKKWKPDGTAYLPLCAENGDLNSLSVREAYIKICDHLKQYGQKCNTQ